MGYEEFLAEHLFEPAGHAQTGYVLPDWDRSQVAVEYDSRSRPQGRPFEHPWAEDGPYWNLRGNGGMLSTARDMFRWHVALDGEDVLDRAAKRPALHPVRARRVRGRHVLRIRLGDREHGGFRPHRLARRGQQLVLRPAHSLPGRRAGWSSGSPTGSGTGRRDGSFYGLAQRLTEESAGRLAPLERQVALQLVEEGAGEARDLVELVE